MSAASESRASLILVADASIETTLDFVAGLDGSPLSRRAAVLDGVPSVISYYSDGSSALAADFYDSERERAGARGRFAAEPITKDPGAKLYNALAWASQPWFDDTIEETAEERLASVVQLHTSTPYRDTITTNRRRDRESVGWQREAVGGCAFCVMLASRGAIYRQETASFAAHPNCKCIAVPVFRGQRVGPEASAMQYVASKRSRTPRQRAALRRYLKENFSE